MEQNPRPQIFRYVTKDKVLDVGDLLDPDPKRCKVRFILLQFGRDFKATTRALHYVDADDLEVVCWDILHGTFREWADHKGSIRDEACQARVLTLRRDPKYDNPYVLQIRNGPGQVIGLGAVKMLKAEVTLSLLLSEFDARRLSLTVSSLAIVASLPDRVCCSGDLRGSDSGPTVTGRGCTLRDVSLLGRTSRGRGGQDLPRGDLDDRGGREVLGVGDYTKAFAGGQFGMFLLGWFPDFVDPDNFLAPWLTESPPGWGPT